MARTARKRTTRIAATRRRLDARPDTADFRDRMFEPTLVEVPPRAPLADYLKFKLPVLDQGEDGACTAFGLATVAHYLLRTRAVVPDRSRVSTRMLYDMARRYDEWGGERYAGSSCRGAMKGWHHHGVCSEALWPYTPGDTPEPYTEERARDAARRPLGAYFRVNHKDLVAMHAAFAEVGILFASCAVHEDWLAPTTDGRIPWRGQEIAGYHAFAIVGYDECGFWLQNSWGRDWGRGGFGHVSYDEWLEHGSDVWVARLAVPIELCQPRAVAISRSSLARQSATYAQADLRSHIVSLGNDGRLRGSGRFGTSTDDVRNLIRDELPRLTRGWKKKRVLLYAHGGLVPEEAAVQRVADYREALLDHEIFPLCFLWRSDLWTTLGNLLRDVARPRAAGLLDRARDLLLDRIDDTLEPLARTLGGKALWDEMKENALLATTAVRRVDGQLQEAGGAALTARLLAEWMANDPDVELHLAAHSGGSVLLAPLVQLLTADGVVPSGPAAGMQGLGRRIESLALWAPAATVDLFLDAYAPAIEAGAIRRAALFTLTERAEQDDQCAGVYHKSLLYLVAHALEAQPRSWIDRDRRHGTPLVGMTRFIEDGPPALRALIASGRLDWIRSPNTGVPVGSPDGAQAATHGAFDDDRAVLAATVARILGLPSVELRYEPHRSEAGQDARRHDLWRALATPSLHEAG
ncbi:MAG TPA: C1 family peptidase [Lysobacter sp.]|nr:C1 family peptidase [Lysobacter sp.]